jgi:hypothetical protein
MLLLTAAGLKGYDLWSNSPATDTRFLTTNWQITLVEAEVVLALWLLSGLWQFGSWVAASVGFVLLASVSLDLAVHKLPCGCLGSVGTRWELSAWHMFAVDLLAVATLLWWRPVRQFHRREWQLKSSYWRFAYFAFLAMVFVGGNAAALFVGVAQRVDRRMIVEELPPIYADPGTRLIHTFAVKNDSHEFQRISTVDHSCICSKALLDRTELNPGDEALLRLEADLTGQRGERVFQSFLRLECGAIWTYSVKTTVYQRLGFDPPNLHFGLVDPGQSKSQSLVLMLHASADGALPRVLSVVPQSDCLRAVWSDAARESASESSSGNPRLVISLVPDTSPGSFSSAVTVRYQLGDHEHEATVPINWNVPSRYEITPRRVFFIRPTESHEELKRMVVIRRLDERPFRIRAIRTSDPLISCTATLNCESPQQDLVIAIDNGGPSPTISGEVVVEIDEPLLQKVLIPVSLINRQAKLPR